MNCEDQLSSISQLYANYKPQQSSDDQYVHLIFRCKSYKEKIAEGKNSLVETFLCDFKHS